MTLVASVIIPGVLTLEFAEEFVTEEAIILLSAEELTDVSPLVIGLRSGILGLATPSQLTFFSLPLIEVLLFKLLVDLLSNISGFALCNRAYLDRSPVLCTKPTKKSTKQIFYIHHFFYLTFMIL